MTTKEIEILIKFKTTIYMSKEDEDLLNEVFIKRLKIEKKQINLRFFAKGLGFYMKRKSNKKIVFRYRDA